MATEHCSRTRSFLVLACALSTLAVHGQTPLLRFRCPAAACWFGKAVDGAGDVNRDGWGDVIVSAQSNQSPLRGEVQVRSGRDGSMIHRVPGPMTQSRFGFSVAGPGDLDRDGHPDFLVGSPAEVSGSQTVGRVYAFSGRDGSRLYTVQGVSPLGLSLARAGDFNGDGVPDFVVGSPTSTTGGEISVFSGPDGSLLARFAASSAGGLLSWSVAGVGDVDRDGRDDVVAWEYLATGERSVKVFSASSAQPIRDLRVNPSPCVKIHLSVAGCGDVDRDSVPDIVIGDGAFSPNSLCREEGRVEVRSGADGRTLFSIVGFDRQRLGVSVCGAGDANGDGWPDFAALSAAGVSVYSGRDGSRLLHARDPRGLGIGYDGVLRPAGDVNRDGWPDLIVGSVGDAMFGQYGGSAVVYAQRQMAAALVGGPACSSSLDPSLFATPPTLGARCDVFGSGAPAGQDGILLMRPDENYWPALKLPGGCFGYWFLGYGEDFPLAYVRADGGGRWQWSAVIPLLPQLDGAVAVVQGLFLRSDFSGVVPTDLLELHLGR